MRAMCIWAPSGSSNMRYLALICVLCLCAVSLESQISPGALHRLIGNPSAGGGGLPVAGVSYWWVSSDLPTNGYVTNWIDKIKGSAWTNGAAGTTRPTNTLTGVYFDGSKSQRLTNSGVYFSSGTAEPSTHWIIINRVGGGAFQDFLDYQNDGVLNWYFDNANRYATMMTPTATYDGRSPTNQWFDWCITMESGGSGHVFYTNGVPAITNKIGQTWTATPWKLMGGISVNGYFTGYIRELAVWSNHLATASEVANLHTYATNTYGYTP